MKEERLKDLKDSFRLKDNMHDFYDQLKVIE